MKMSVESALESDAQIDLLAPHSAYNLKIHLCVTIEEGKKSHHGMFRIKLHEDEEESSPGFHWIS